MNKDITIQQTPEALRDDIEEVYNYAKNNSRIDTDKILILAHSEGSVHVAYLVKNKKINPKAIHFMGMISESPASLIKWQMVDRINDIILSLDKNKDNKITNTELDKAQGFNATFAKAYKKEKNGYWKKSDLIKKLENDYLETKKDAISHKDSEVIFGYNSYKWWKMFFEDNNKVINNLLEYEGKIYVHNGDIDSQTPATREFKFIKEVENKFKIKPTLKLYKNKGHTLSNDRLFGPIDDNSKRELIKYIEESVK